MIRHPAMHRGEDRAVERPRAAWREPETVVSLLALTAAFVSGAIFSSGRLGSLLIDTGRELEVARRMLHGESLYSELRYYWGPLGPYLDAALYAAFGVSTRVLASAGLVTAAVMCCSLYALARQFLRPWQSASATLPFIALSAFPRLIPDAVFNFVLPFNFGATYGVTLATLSVLLLVVHVRTRRPASFVISALLLGLVGLTKLEIFFAAGITHAVFVLGSLRRLRRVHLVAYLASACLLVGAYGALYLKAGPALWTENLGALFNAGSRTYIRETMGTADLAGNAARMLGSLAALAVTVTCAWAAARVTTGRALPRVAAQVIALGLGAATFGAYALLPISVAWAGVPLVATGVVAALILGRGRAPVTGKLEPHDRLRHLLLWTFGLALLLRVLLRAGPMHYGFVLLPPSVVCLAVLLYDDLPRLAGGRPAERLFFAAAGSGLLLGSLAGPVLASASYYGDRDVAELVTPTTRLVLHRGSPELSIVPLLQRYPAGTRAVVIPEGVGLVFASGLSGADGMFSYLPMELVGPQEDRVLEVWRRSPPDVIVWWRRDEPMFGYRGFGVDYGTRLAGWIGSHYAPVTDPNLWMVVLERRRQ
jgi:hypothetical protein